jgi:hypothetical protein
MVARSRQLSICNSTTGIFQLQGRLGCCKNLVLVGLLRYTILSGPRVLPKEAFLLEQPPIRCSLNWFQT